MGKKNGKCKLKVMKHVEAKHAQEVEKAEPKPDAVDENLERAFQALKDLGGSATSPQLVEKLGFTGESKRDQVRRLMDRLIAAKRVKKHKQDKSTETAKRGYHYTLVEAKVEPKPLEVAAA